ncbi:abortive infection system toxin AbiGii family protein [Bacillus zanthoxyli]|nr:abortive infection system toxin AbiGii family protein [Bacillus zanthoxyli]
MLNKGPSIKQEGEKNLAIQNSSVSIVISAFDEIAKLGQKGDYEGVFNLMSKLQDLSSIQHPYYPHYTYKTIDLGGRMFVEHEPRSEEDAKLFPLSYQGKFNIPKEETEGFKNFEELLHDAYIKQREIEIDVLSLQALIKGEKVVTPFLENTLKESKWFIKPEPLPEAIKLNFFASDDSKDTLILDYLEFSISDIDKVKNAVTIDNSRQKHCKLDVKLFIPLEGLKEENGKSISSNVRLNIKIRNGFEHNVEANKLLLKFLILSKNEHLKLIFKDLDNGRNFMSTRGVKSSIHDIEDLENEIKLFERLYKLEKHFGVIFSIPEKIEKEDMEAVEILESIMLNQSIKKKLNWLTIDVKEKDFLTSIINLFEKYENRGQKLMVQASGPLARIELFETQIPLEKVETIYNDLKLENLDKVKRKCEDMEEGELIKVKLIPDTSKEVEERFFIREQS